MKLFFLLLSFLPITLAFAETSNTAEFKQFRNTAMDAIDNPYCRSQFKRYLTKPNPKVFIYVPRQKERTAYCRLGLTKLAKEKNNKTVIERCERKRKKAKKNPFIASCKIFARDNTLLLTRADFGLEPLEKDIFYIAERYGVDALTKEVEAGTDINKQNALGFTPLLIATLENNFDQLKYLISKGADLNIKNNQGEDALILATKNNQVKTFEYLIEQGADINTVSDKNQRHAIHIAARGGFLNIIESLLNKGVDIDKATANGESPLMLAIQSHFKPVVKYVVEKGADINVKDASGITPLDYARKYKNNRIIDFLIQKGAKSATDL